MSAFSEQQLAQLKEITGQRKAPARPLWEKVGISGGLGLIAALVGLGSLYFQTTAQAKEDLGPVKTDVSAVVKVVQELTLTLEGVQASSKKNTELIDKLHPRSPHP